MSDKLSLLRSRSRAIRARAAAALVADVNLPLENLLEILDGLHNQGVGAATQRALLRRTDPELMDQMMLRLRSPAPFVREVACRVLAHAGDPRAARSVAGALEDPSPGVRRAAAYALAELKDPASAQPLLARYDRAVDDSNVRSAIECALDALEVSYVKQAWRRPTRS